MLLLLALTLVAANPKKKVLSQLEAAKDFLEVPAGVVYVNEEQQQLDHFYISKYEVSNAQYQAFLDDLKAQEKDELYALAQPKTQKPASWQKMPLVNDSYFPEYFSYKGFADFPVLGISYPAAQAYCKWLSEKASKEVSGQYNIQFRLPTEAEWIRAARGETQNEYAWGSPYLRDGKGYFYCNFKRISAEQVTYNVEKNVYEIVPPPSDYEEHGLPDKVNAYDANEFGLHNMCGNVAEMVSLEGIALGGSWNDTGYDVRIESVSQYEGTSPYVGFRPVMILTEK
ncbi:SUMF1/EgtB/PvdO family nonheme iron enzyme [Catalinimonas sp. 4WD22]|uniref:formylglycine-generating enzyme family protein n=1 Tax=Catalinimonas locisalis TaxID=3133978 RepID=UPI003101059B